MPNIINLFSRTNITNQKLYSAIVPICDLCFINIPNSRKLVLMPVSSNSVYIMIRCIFQQPAFLNFPKNDRMALRTTVC